MASAIEEYRKKFGDKGVKQKSAIQQYRENNKQTTARTPSPIEAYRNQKGIKPKNSDLKSTDGLYNTAVNSGLQKQADRIVQASTGEETKKIFSGGFISDILDVTSALQYGVVGMLKGKTFNEGVKTRQSFTDQDALGDEGVPGVIAGVALDILADPLTYIAPWTLAKKIPGAVQAVKAVKNATVGKRVTKAIQGTDKTFETLEGGTIVGRYLGQKFTWMFGADPVFKETFERGLKNTAVSSQAIVDLGKSVAKLKPETAAKILGRDATGRFIRNPLQNLGLSADELEPVAKLYKRIDDLGAEAVDLGLLSKAKYEENIGQYIKNAYEEYELAKGKGIFGGATVGIKGIKNRVEDLTPEQMKELGQIDNPAYLLFKSAFDLTKDVENAKLFKAVGDRFATDVAQDGFVKLPTGTRLGSLAGKYVPDNVALYLNEVVRPAEEGIEKMAKKLIADFKFFKVVMNPATHARNLMSNKILNYWKLGMNPLDPRVIANDVETLREIAKGSGKWIDEAKPLGYNVDTFASAEMKSLLESSEASAWGKTQGAWKTIKKKLGDLYQAEENQAKLSAYIWNRKKGLVPEEAWKAAESATFNYAQVTPFIRKLRESLFGMPFITFTTKATPVAVETVLKNPKRISIIQKIKQAIESQSDIKETDRERESEPEWVKNGFYIKLPMKDKEGRSAYFDLTYILPFGDIMAGSFVERGTNLKTGLPEGLPRAALRKSPFLNLVGELYQNKDFYGNKIWRESDSTDKQVKDIMRHLTKTYVPPAISDQIGGGYNEKGERKITGFRGAKEASSDNQNRSTMQELLRHVGMKIQPLDADIQETYQDWNRKKGLENLLIENGVLNKFEKTYVPKD